MVVLSKSPEHDALCLEAQEYFETNIIPTVKDTRFKPSVTIDEMLEMIATGRAVFDGGAEAFSKHRVFKSEYMFDCAWEFPLFDPPKYKSEPYLSGYCDLLFTVYRWYYGLENVEFEYDYDLKTKKEKPRRTYLHKVAILNLIIECKPSIESVGETIRQMRRYKYLSQFSNIKSDQTNVVLYTHDRKFEKVFESNGFHVYPLERG